MFRVERRRASVVAAKGKVIVSESIVYAAGARMSSAERPADIVSTGTEVGNDVYLRPWRGVELAGMGPCPGGST